MSTFAELLSGAVLLLNPEQISRLEAHYRLLELWNRKLNLTAIRSLEEAVQRHYVESLFLAGVVAQCPWWGEVRTVADVGSGGGFPGIPVAVAHPERRFLLIESHQRKSVFLSEATRNLSNVDVAPARFETLEGPFDLILSRAVAWEQISGHAARVGRFCGLLVGPSDLDQVLRDSRVRWSEPVPLPFRERGVVLTGTFHVEQ